MQRATMRACVVWVTVFVGSLYTTSADDLGAGSNHSTNDFATTSGNTSTLPNDSESCGQAYLDDDGNVDQEDFDVFQSCASGPGIPHDGSRKCQQADFDRDGDVDQDDFAVFQRCYGRDNILKLYVTSPNTMTLYHHTVMVTLAAADMGDGFYSFNRLRFDCGGQPCDYFIAREGETSADIWLRIPELSPGRNIIDIYGGDANTEVRQAESFAAQVVADSMVDINLPTDLKVGTGSSKKRPTGTNLPCVHPSVIEAQGWMRHADGENGMEYDRVLIDTIWTPARECPNDTGGYYANSNNGVGALENPSVWVRRVSDKSWVWPQNTKTDAGSPYAEDALYPSIPQDDGCIITGGVYEEVGSGLTRLTANSAVFLDGHVGKTITIEGIGDFVIAAVVSTTQVNVLGDASMADADKYSLSGKTNRLVSQPSGNPAYYNADPTAVWVPANTFGGGYPATDTLAVYYRCTKTQSSIVYVLLTTSGGWDEVEIDRGAGEGNATNLTNLGNDNGIAPVVMIDPNGGRLLMWTTNQIARDTDPASPHYLSYTYKLELWASTPATNGFAAWKKFSDCTLNLPIYMRGPWHFDVKHIGDQYWLAGSFASSRVQTHPYHDIYMAHSQDGITWTLILPAIASRGIQLIATGKPNICGWCGWSLYKPAILYTEGTGLDVYIGSANPVKGEEITGGVRSYVDAGWSPTIPRIVEAIGTVFWGRAKDFTTAYNAWPYPYSREVPALSTPTTSNSILTIMGNAHNVNSIYKDMFVAPTLHECHVRLKVPGTAHNFVLGSSNYYGPHVGNPAAVWQGDDPVEYQWNTGTVSERIRLKLPSVDIGTNFHDLALRVLGNVVSMKWDDVNLTDGVGSTEYTRDTPATAQSEFVNQLLCKHRNEDPNPRVYHIDWIFFRDAVPNEPTTEWKVRE